MTIYLVTGSTGFIVSLVSPRIKYKINKLLGDVCYSSAKLDGLGFKAQKALKDMNETSF